MEHIHDVIDKFVPKRHDNQASNSSYSAVPAVEQHNDAAEEKAQSTHDTIERTSSITVKFVAAIVAIFSIGFLSIAFIHQQHWQNQQQLPSSINTSSQLEPLHCGTSREEAISLGCQFDLMSFCWLPAPCYDGELTAEFLTVQDWKWYNYDDNEGTVPVSKEIAESAVHDTLYVTMDYHLVHCTYMWRKLHRALGKGWPIDSYIGNYTHTRHCAKQVLKNEPDSDTKLLFISVQYQSCPILSREVFRDEVLMESVEANQDYIA